MARDAREREDLLRDARGLMPRAALLIEGEELVFGFRGESLSLYFGQDFVFHFNGHRELRRAFLGERLLKAVDRRLVAMSRERTAGEVILRSHFLPPTEEQVLLDDLQSRLNRLASALASGRFQVVGEVPAGGDAVSRLAAWIAAVHEPILLAITPNVG